MDTTQVPEFKLAKVGKRRERKKAGFFWLNGGAGAGGFTGATGGLGAFMGTTIAKVLVLGLLATLSVGAYNVGMSMSANNGKGVPGKPKLFDAKDKNASANASAIVGPAPASGLAMVEGSLDGKTPEQRAAEAAAAEAAAKAEADKKAQDEAAKKAQEEADAKKAADEAAKAQAPAVPDPAAVASNNAGGKNNPFSKHFGALSSSLGGGHSGLAGGAGLSGGIGRSFNSMPSFGKAQAQSQQAAPKRVTAKAVQLHGHSGRAFRQLVAANGQSQAARRSGTAETAVQSADSAFENNPGANQAITGGGAGQGGAGTGDTAPGGGGNTGSGNSSGPTGCTGDCSGGAPGSGHKDASPWKDQIQLAARLTVIASGLLILAGIFSFLSNSAGFWTQGFKIAAQVCGGVAAAMGAVVLGLGVSISGKGGPGTMYTITGGIITAAGALVALVPTKGSEAVLGVNNTMAIAASMFTGLLAGATNVQAAWGNSVNNQ